MVNYIFNKEGKMVCGGLNGIIAYAASEQYGVFCYSHTTGNLIARLRPKK